jgi:hypothetical protein
MLQQAETAVPSEPVDGRSAFEDLPRADGIGGNSWPSPAPWIQNASAEKWEISETIC